MRRKVRCPRRNRFAPMTNRRTQHNRAGRGASRRPSHAPRPLLHLAFLRRLLPWPAWGRWKIPSSGIARSHLRLVPGAPEHVRSARPLPLRARYAVRRPLHPGRQEAHRRAALRLRPPDHQGDRRVPGLPLRGRSHHRRRARVGLHRHRFPRARRLARPRPLRQLHQGHREPEGGAHPPRTSAERPGALPRRRGTRARRSKTAIPTRSGRST